MTHDHYEALLLADLLVIMNRGHVEQVGTYEEIYDKPETIFVAGFLNRHIGAPPISFLDAEHLEPEPISAHAQIGVRSEDIEVSGELQQGSVEGRIVGNRVWLTLKRYHIFDRATGKRARTVTRRC